MERAKYLVVIICTVLAYTTAGADDRSGIYRAYVSNNMAEWKNTIDRMQSAKSKTNEYIMELVNYQYGYVAWCLGKKRKDEAEKYLELAEEHIDKLEEAKYSPSMVQAYKAAFYGYRIGLSPWKAPFIGPKSSKSAERAVKYDAKNWFAYVQQGNIQYYMPAIFGGSKTEAIAFYLKAKNLMEKNSAQVAGDWNYLSLLTIIAQAYVGTNDFQSAKNYYELALKAEPEFTWVKNELYPELRKKMGK